MPDEVIHQGLEAVLTLNDSPYTQALAQIEGRTKSWAGTIQRIVGTISVAAFAKKAVTEALSYDAALRRVDTIARQSAVGLKNLGEAAKTIALNLGQDQVDVLNGIYEALSSNIPPDNVLSFVETASKAAIAGVSNTQVATKAIAAAINAYGLQVKDATRVSDIYFKTIEHGVITFDELGAQMGDVLTLGAQAGIELEELSAAVATITLKGVPAAEAVTSLKNLLTTYISPSAEATKAAKFFGLELSAAHLKATGLAGAMEELRTKTKGSVEAIGAIIPEVRGMRAGLVFAGDQSAIFAEKLKAIKDNAGSTEAALRRMQAGVSFTAKQIGVAIKEGFGEAGTMMMKPFQILLDGNTNTALQAIRDVLSSIGLALQAVGTEAAILASYFQIVYQSSRMAFQAISGKDTTEAQKAIFDLEKKVVDLAQALVQSGRDMLARGLPTHIMDTAHAASSAAAKAVADEQKAKEATDKHTKSIQEQIKEQERLNALKAGRFDAFFETAEKENAALAEQRMEAEAKSREWAATDSAVIALLSEEWAAYEQSRTLMAEGVSAIFQREHSTLLSLADAYGIHFDTVSGQFASFSQVIQEDANQLTVTLTQNTTQAVGSAIQAMALGQLNAKQALRQFAAQQLAVIGQMLANMLVQYIVFGRAKAAQETTQMGVSVATSAATGAAGAASGAAVALPYPANIIVPPIVAAAMFALIMAFTSKGKSGGKSYDVGGVVGGMNAGLTFGSPRNITAHDGEIIMNPRQQQAVLLNMMGEGRTSTPVQPPRGDNFSVVVNINGNASRADADHIGNVIIEKLRSDQQARRFIRDAASGRPS